MNKEDVEKLIKIRDKTNLPLNKIRRAYEKVGPNENAIILYLQIIGQAVCRRHKDGTRFTNEDYENYAVECATGKRP
jgi:hypothetical protein